MPTKVRSSSGLERRRDRFVARVLAASLERRLANGCPPAASRALAIRADQLVGTGERQALAKEWAHLLELAHQPFLPLAPQIPLKRDRILAAETELRQMMTLLVTPFPVTPSGVAKASLLLTDGAGPVWNGHSQIDLGNAISQVTKEMDPFSDVA
ncbi:MAG TPA: hypothetical protein VGP46_02785 [Acidimicrobiales bacterium]|jgi:hypothetical protein|nr:hypothetical protein [Acidimicrobiales bacterium]